MFKIRTKKSVKRKKTSGFDKNLLVITFILVIVGIIFMADASAPKAIKDFGDKYYFVRQQLLWLGVGLVLMVFTSVINYKIWEKWAVIIFFFSLFSLVAVLIPGIGVSLLGARRWINIFGVSFQPSEFAKLALAIYLAKVAAKGKRLSAFFLPLIAVSIITMLQPDLGTTIIIVAIAMIQIFISGINLLYMFGAVIFLGISAMVLILTSDYRRDRLFTYLEQTTDPLGKGYHIRQILYALGSGGFLGVGLGQSMQKHLFLPETATDSIFAVIAEEIGFLGASFFIFLFVFLIFRIMKISKGAPDVFGKVLAMGISGWFGAQIILNVSSMVVLVPLTGIPLPFISYGGSAIVSNLIAIGVLLNISKKSHEKD